MNSGVMVSTTKNIAISVGVTFQHLIKIPLPFVIIIVLNNIFRFQNFDFSFAKLISLHASK